MLKTADPRVEATLNTALRANNAALWRAAWRAAVVTHVVVPRALELFDPITVTFAAEWRSLDDSADRLTRVRAAAIQDAACEDLLQQEDALNAALAQAGLKKERLPRLRRFLRPLVDQLVAEPVSDTELQTIFPEAWRPLADAIAQKAHQRRKLNAKLEDWSAMNERLTAGFFASCGLHKASLVEAALRRMADGGPLGIRGRLVRLVEQTSANGIEDVTPPLAVPFTLQPLAHASLSDVLAATRDAWTSTEQGNGVMHRFLDVNAPSPRDLPQGITHANLVAGRSASYRQHEYTITTYLALSSIEQLLRGMAERAGVAHLHNSVLDWIDKISATPIIRDAVNVIYDRKRGNLRNRFMHAGLLDIESSRMEQTLRAAGRNALPVNNAPYAPRNIAALSVSALAAIDAELARTGPLTPAHFAWSSRLDLTAGEIAFGAGMPFDFASAEGVELQKQMSNFLTVVTPAASQLFQLGFVGWIGRKNADTLPKFVAMLIVFEGLARMVTHLCGLPVLQWDDRNGRCLYVMFDDRGLASPRVRDRICAELSPADRKWAHQTLTLALKARNAFAHGAILTAQGPYFDAIGQLVVKSALTFMAAGEHHMIREAAYFEGQRHEGNLDNWLSAERSVLANIQALARAR